jgi:hypothetical protein
LRTAIESGRIPSLLLWGPPGTGKTTIAHVIAHTLQVPFFMLSAISAGVKEVREVIAQAQNGSGAILFIDEIHRFNKGQQDALLGAVERGTVTLNRCHHRKPVVRSEQCLAQPLPGVCVETLAGRSASATAASCHGKRFFFERKKDTTKRNRSVADPFRRRCTQAAQLIRTGGYFSFVQQVGTAKPLLPTKA